MCIRRHTAMGFASVLTNSEVTLSVRDMVEYGAEVEEGTVWAIALRQWAHRSRYRIKTIDGGSRQLQQVLQRGASIAVRYDEG